MRTSLDKTYRKFLSRTTHLLSIFLESELRISHRVGYQHSSIMAQEMAIIRIHDEWSRYCKELIILSACGKPVTLSGTVLPRIPKFRSKNDVIREVSTHFKATNRPQNIPWHVPQHIVPLVNKLKLANRSNISAGIGATPSPIDDLRNIRNFLAHKNEISIKKVHETAKALGLSSQFTALNIVKQFDPSRSFATSYIESWVNTLQVMAFVAAQ